MSLKNMVCFNRSPIASWGCAFLSASYKEDSEDTSNRVLSIGTSWTRKALSGVRVYAEHRDLAFFLYERFLAQKFFAAHSRSQRMGVTADVMVRDSQLSSGYWEIQQEALADLVRIMVHRCYDEENYKDLPPSQYIYGTRRVLDNLQGPSNVCARWKPLSAHNTSCKRHITRATGMQIYSNVAVELPFVNHEPVQYI